MKYIYREFQLIFKLKLQNFQWFQLKTLRFRLMMKTITSVLYDAIYKDIYTLDRIVEQQNL